jgi:cysteine desulfurase family protein (TIGR01976 family)
VQAARRAGASVRYVDVELEDCTLCWDSFSRALTDRTRLLAVGYASNAVGTINPVQRLVAAARSVGAVTYVDAVHFAPHALLDVQEVGCDFLVCSAYKFFGPHVGLLWGRRDLLESLEPEKLRPSPETVPERWMMGTQNHEGLAGVTAAVDYLAGIGRHLHPLVSRRREQLRAAFAALVPYEQELGQRLVRGLETIPGVRLWGITAGSRSHERVPTVSLTMAGRTPKDLAGRLAAEGLYTWAGNHYALPFTEAAGLEPHGTLRIGLLHYNTAEEVDRLVATLARLC